MELKEIIQKKPYLFWFVKEPENLSTEAVVEAILNFGDWEDVQNLLKILGTKETAEIFQNKLKKSRNNFRPEIENYFKMYFQKYA